MTRATGPSLPAPDPGLLALIRDEIRRAGPITFARFMDLALYTPEVGYYLSPEARMTRTGDFLTAPELHPIFGATLARHAAAVWRAMDRPATFTIREYGAGTGALARSILAAFAEDAPDLAAIVRYEAIEANPHRRAELAPPIVGVDPAADPRPAAPAAGFAIANEYVDAFPVHRVQQTAQGLRERHVDIAVDGFVEVLGPPSTVALADRLAADGVTLADGQIAEIALGQDAWFRDIGARVSPAVVVVIDYGARAPDLYGPRHPVGTLLGYAGHRVVDDPLAAPGRQDLTAHVDFTALETAAAAAGFTAVAFLSQADYLVQVGLEALLERARSDPSRGLADWATLRSAIVRLLDPRHTGGFRVLVVAGGIAAEAVQPAAVRPGP